MSPAIRYRVDSTNIDVYDRIRKMIADRELAPGARLVQGALAKRFGTSAMPIVESLRRLERDGLVTHVPNVGTFVAESTVEDLRDLYVIRRGLETEACRLFVERGDASDLRILKKLNDQLNATAIDANISGFLKADFKFHMHIVLCARSPRLRDIIETRRIEERLFQSGPALLEKQGDTSSLIGMHDAITNAILAGDAIAAAEAMRIHLVDSEKQTIEMFG